jgi:flavin reductase (DIM6/NTAB) family NADH-FMN oxidoreductase RutF
MNMEKMTIGQAQKITSPNPFGIITVKKPDGTTNAMAISWWNYASNHPATITACLSRKGYSGECIRNEKSFGLNIVSEIVRDAAYACGTCSGRAMDKASEKGLPLVEAEGYNQKMVENSALWMSCKLVNYIDVGDHILYIAEVEQIDGDINEAPMFAWNGYGKLDKAE